MNDEYIVTIGGEHITIPVSNMEDAEEYIRNEYPHLSSDDYEIENVNDDNRYEWCKKHHFD